MKRPNSTIEGLLLVLFLIPIVVFFILKWIVQGIAALVVSIKNK